MYLLVYIRQKLKVTKQMQAGETLKYASIMTPIINPMASGLNMSQAYEQYRQEIDPFFNFTGQTILNGTMLHRFNPSRCGAIPDNKERNHYAIAPDDDEVALSIGRDIELFNYILNNINKVHAGILNNDEDKDGRPNFVVKLKTKKNLKP
mmetsp:Transcript_28946/g.27870  ORF Transcript_28946/g.27870 Transcript_28946/m.27870 type:complete len:150 (+) Transcript_28946:166-615(+)